MKAKPSSEHYYLFWLARLSFSLVRLIAKSFPELGKNFSAKLNAVGYDELKLSRLKKCCLSNTIVSHAYSNVGWRRNKIMAREKKWNY